MELVTEKYKKTEVGLIPNDWQVINLGDVANIIGGGTPSSFINSYWNGDINWYTPTEIGKEKYSFQSIRKITKLGFDNCSTKMLPVGTILLTTRAGIGDVSILMNAGCTNQGFQSFVAKNNIDNEYLYYLISTLQNVFLQNASGSTFLEISPNKIKAIQIPLPPFLAEQTAIATALSDADALISSLEKLITKKRNIKQGAMQKLLQSKEGWEVKKLGALDFDISDGNYSSKYPSSSEFKPIGIPFIRANNIKKMTVIDDDMRFISSDLHIELAKGHLKSNDILITTRGEIGQIAILPKKFIDANINAQIVRINTNEKINSLYFAYFLQKSETQTIFLNLQTGSALKQLPVGKLKQIEIVYPSLEEQTRIATILSDMDNEINALETKLNKYKKIKLGMMQNLLTGKIRLV